MREIAEREKKKDVMREKETERYFMKEQGERCYEQEKYIF
jgi:hypothetical protein